MESEKSSVFEKYIEQKLKDNKIKFKEIVGHDINNYTFEKSGGSEEALSQQAQILILKNEILECLKEAYQSINCIYQPPDFSDETYEAGMLDQNLSLAPAYAYMLDSLMNNEYIDFINEIDKEVIQVLSCKINDLKKFCPDIRNQENKNIMDMTKNSYAEKMENLLKKLGNPIEALSYKYYAQKIAGYREIIATKGISKVVVKNLFDKLDKTKYRSEKPKGKNILNPKHQKDDFLI